VLLIGERLEVPFNVILAEHRPAVDIQLFGNGASEVGGGCQDQCLAGSRGRLGREILPVFLRQLGEHKETTA